MPTYTALTTLPDEAAATALGDAMERMVPAPDGVGVFEIEDGSALWEVGGYFTSPPDATALAVLEAAFGARPFAVSEVPQTDWVAKVRRELVPIEAGRFFLYGSHDADRVPPDRVALLVDAAMAFGTGHHGTTKGCLLALDDLLTDGVAADRVADIGCGTAVLAMAAARVWPAATILAADIDAVAVEVAAANVALNDLSGRIVCIEAAGFDHADLTGWFDLIFANILKGPLLDLAPDIAAQTAPGGHVILSGLLTPQAEEVIARYAAHGLILRRHRTEGDWRTLTLQRAGADRR